MLSYPIMTGSTTVDDRVYARLCQGAISQKLSDAQTQHCIITFARSVLQSLGERKLAGEPMAGTGFVNWLETLAQGHPLHYLNSYRAASGDGESGIDSLAFEISRSFSSKQNEIGACASEAVMLSDRDGVLASAACQLTASSRIIIVWHYFGGFSVGEIAQKIGESEARVRSRIVRAGREMQMVLGRLGDPAMPSPVGCDENVKGRI